MSMNISADDSWVPEPELLESAPRRIVPFTDYPDLNRPNLPLYLGIGGVVLVGGIVLFALGVGGKGATFTGIGIALIALALAALIYFPWKSKQYQQRVEHLITNGIPVMARILTTENLDGSTYSRSVTYQISTITGELAHRTVNADDRVLPKRIPSNVSALMDLKSGDVELYCALPFRAIPKKLPAPNLQATATGQVPTSPTTLGGTPTSTGAMGTMTTPTTEVKREKPKEEEPQKKRETFE